MNEEEILTMINLRGRRIYVDRKNLKAALDEGLRVFPNAKEEYYPEFDTEYNKLAPQTPLPTDNTEDKLDVIVL